MKYPTTSLVIVEGRHDATPKYVGMTIIEDIQCLIQKHEQGRRIDLLEKSGDPSKSVKLIRAIGTEGFQYLNESQRDTVVTKAFELSGWPDSGAMRAIAEGGLQHLSETQRDTLPRSL